MHAKDLMSSPVISVPPSLPVCEVAALLHERRIGGVPVMAGDELLGMVTEADLIQRFELGTDRRVDARPWWRRLRHPDEVAHAYVKSHGQTAVHVMTRGVRVVDEDAELAQVAALLESGIGRAPVVRGRRVVGIVARADLIRALAARRERRPPPAGLRDEAIRQLLVAELQAQPWWNGGWENVYVAQGVVTFKGVVESEPHRLAARVAAEGIPGVRGVRDDRLLASELPTML